MATKWLRYILMISLLFICIACDIKGANNPYCYDPYTPCCLPTTTPSHPIAKDIEEEREDYYQSSQDCPLTLAEIIDIALTKNPDTKKSWALARVSAAEYGQSLKDQFILAEIKGNYSHTRSTDTKTGINSLYQKEYESNLELTYRILDFGQTRMSSRAALYSLFYANWSHNSQIQKTIQTIMTNYYNYLYQKRLLFSAEQDVANARLSFDVTQEKLRQGIATRSDTIQAKTSYLQKKLNVVTQKKNLYDSYTLLVHAMGLPSNEVLCFEDYPEKIELIKLEDLDKLIVKATENRPDLLAHEASLQSSQATLQSESLQKLPVITGKCDIGHRYQHGLNSTRGMNSTYNISAQIHLSLPLFQGFYIENAIKIARAKLESAEATLKQVHLSIIQEVSNYRSDANYAQESIKYAQAYLDSAEKEYEVNLKRYKVGTGTIVDLINAQTAIADARARLAQAQNYWYRSIANLAYATGTLFPVNHKNLYPHVKERSNAKPSL